LYKTKTTGDICRLSNSRQIPHSLEVALHRIKRFRWQSYTYSV